MESVDGLVRGIIVSFRLGNKMVCFYNLVTETTLSV